MKRDGLKRGIATLCIGGGQGIALALEGFEYEQALRADRDDVMGVRSATLIRHAKIRQKTVRM